MPGRRLTPGLCGLGASQECQRNRMVQPPQTTFRNPGQTMSAQSRLSPTVTVPSKGVNSPGSGSRGGRSVRSANSGHRSKGRAAGYRQAAPGTALCRWVARYGPDEIGHQTTADERRALAGTGLGLGRRIWTVTGAFLLLVAGGGQRVGRPGPGPRRVRRGAAVIPRFRGRAALAHTVASLDASRTRRRRALGGGGQGI